MLLKKLRLTNFRNLPTVDLEFSDRVVFIGKNAQGKSNLLEAIYFLATTKSPRADLDLQLIKQDEVFCRVEGDIEEQGETTNLEIAMQKKEEGGLEKRVRVNGISRRTLDYIGNLVVVYFAPEDINLVTGPPALRRWHIDLTLAQVDRHYKNALTDYSSALTSRNRVLKRIREGLAQIDELEFWTESILKAGAIVAEKRENFFEKVNNRELVFEQSEEWGKLNLIYHQNILSPERLQQYQAREIASATSLIGPHRDDFTFILDDKNLAHFGSRGQQRLAVLELKLAELNFIKDFQQTTPILVLDDVFSELDEAHRELVIKVVGQQQTILSVVEQTQLPKDFLKSVQMIKVEKGQLFNS